MKAMVSFIFRGSIYNNHLTVRKKRKGGDAW